jgi:hypothetical protein
MSTGRLPFSSQADLTLDAHVHILDLDGDSEMMSSSESSEISNPQTPTDHQPSAHPGHFAGSELSPPGSQDASGAGQGGERRKSETITSAPFGVDNTEKDKAAEQGRTDIRNEPGAAWMNKRAEEEYQRAMEYVVDRDFSLSERTWFPLGYFFFLFLFSLSPFYRMRGGRCI